MSQHIFTTYHQDKKINIVTGWSVKHQGYFMFVTQEPIHYNRERFIDEKSYLYSSEEDECLKQGVSGSLEHCTPELNALNLTLPKVITERLCEDFLRDDNRVMQYWFEDDRLVCHNVKRWKMTQEQAEYILMVLELAADKRKRKRVFGIEEECHEAQRIVDNFGRLKSQLSLTEAERVSRLGFLVGV